MIGSFALRVATCEQCGYQVVYNYATQTPPRQCPKCGYITPLTTTTTKKPEEKKEEKKEDA
jgi:predicted Zn-ribbon and HTH transcriptional regulator